MVIMTEKSMKKIISTINSDIRKLNSTLNALFQQESEQHEKSIDDTEEVVAIEKKLSKVAESEIKQLSKDIEALHDALRSYLNELENLKIEGMDNSTIQDIKKSVVSYGAWKEIIRWVEHLQKIKDIGDLTVENAIKNTIPSIKGTIDILQADVEEYYKVLRDNRDLYGLRSKYPRAQKADAPGVSILKIAMHYFKP